MDVEITGGRAYLLALAAQAERGNETSRKSLATHVARLIDRYGTPAAAALAVDLNPTTVWKWLQPGGVLARYGEAWREAGIIRVNRRHERPE
jgi:hypothetical protein